MSCPVDHTPGTAKPANHPPSPFPSPPAECPMHKPTNQPAPPPGCPMHNSSSETINPLNNMPNLSNTPSAATKLPTEREASSIPRSSSSPSETWSYPSPQQFFNALARKNKAAPVEEIETMVAIHNFLNEGTWDEIRRWEKKYHNDCSVPRSLNQFRGRPDDPSPKSLLYRLFTGARTFDRHDWYVDRCGRQVRYVVDYYSSPEEEVDGMPAFNVDVRPAVDSFTDGWDRVREGCERIWSRAFGQTATEAAPTS
ncbi:cytochrome c/c1 heme-lyase [Phlyctochytrium arcticum]|nr:cytochrome c/c1 heme-lyase [Phlyctochytrium arcticum]